MYPRKLEPNQQKQQKAKAIIRNKKLDFFKSLKSHLYTPQNASRQPLK